MTAAETRKGSGAADLNDFIARQRNERRAAGLPETIIDTDFLRVVAALVAEGVHHDRHAA